MTIHETIQANKKIASFIGVNVTCKTQVNSFNPHRNWSQLMLAVEKICQFKYDNNEYAYIRTFGMIDDEGLYMVRINRCFLFSAKTLIEATHLAVIDFIDWYNKRKKHYHEYNL